MTQSRKRHRVEKDDLYRSRFRKKEAHINALKTTMINVGGIATKKRMLATATLSKLQNQSSYVKIRNRCVLTGRARGIYNYFKISRIMIRELASKGLLPGVKKAT